ncbi:MAG: hypothetical protein LBR84_09345 [Tannerella sp.]|jgi:hypothetical protein|nr:hypothetical protein [Tannerella sp.]
MAKNEWVPKGHEDLHTQANQTATYLAVSTNLTRMGLSGASSWISTEFTSKLTPMNTAYTAWQNPATRTPELIANLNNAEAVFVPAYRKLYTGFLRENPLVTDAASPITFTFTGEQRGQCFYFALRWKNTRGDKGPWSEIGSAVIP